MATTPKPALGPLAKVISKPKFENGVLVGCTIVKDADHLAGHARWSTVRTLDAGEYASADYATVYRHPVMKALRTVRVDPADDLVELCTGKQERPFTCLVVDWLSTVEQAAALARATALPDLRALEVTCTCDRALAPAIMEAVAAAKVERLRIQPSSFVLDFGATVAKARHISRLEIIDRTHLATELVIEGGACAVTVRLDEKHPAFTVVILDALDQALASLPRMPVTLTAKPPAMKAATTSRLSALAKRYG